MTPLERYRADLSSGEFQPDPGQETVVLELQRVYDGLTAGPSGRTGLLQRLGIGPSSRPAAVTGVYLWGGVGRGKTHLVNQLYDSLPFPEKRRVHFHLFMQELHRELKRLAGTRDPLTTVAQGLAERLRILCLDEFHVTDITDAMLLGRLLAALFEQGVTLVTTSNTRPDELYRDGLQRERFLPAIELIEARMRVVRLEGEEDYRLRRLERAEIYHFPLDAEADATLLKVFRGLVPEGVVEGGAIAIDDRPIPCVRRAEGIAWLAFTALCDQPRGSADYIEIARRFHTLFLADIPRMGDGERDQAARFIRLIDILYDHNVNLVASAAAAPAELCTLSPSLSEQFARTSSRLEEMRSTAYLARSHLS